MYDYPEISECIWYSLSKNILCFCQSFRILFILIIDPITQGSLSPGIHHWGRGVSASLSRLCYLRRTTILHPFFLIGGPRGAAEEKLKTPSNTFHLWWRWNLKIYLAFYLLYKHIVGFSFSLSPAIWTWRDSCLWLWRMGNIYVASVKHEGRGTFLSYGLYAHL